MAEGAAAAGREALAEELRALGGLLQAQPVEDLADRVLARVGTAPAPAARPARWRRAAAVVAALLLAVGLAAAVSPQVRAAIGEVFRFGGVEVRPGPGPSPTPAPPLLPGEHRTDLAGAAAEVGFVVRVPAALGAPAQVTVTDGRVMSLQYPARAGQGAVRLDEFAGTLGVMWEKYAGIGQAERVDVGGLRGLWFGQPVDLVYVDRAGQEHPESARRTSRTLVWTDGALTFRLDGLASADAAVAVARTMH
jgi:hypothetical protein